MISASKTGLCCDSCSCMELVRDGVLDGGQLCAHCIPLRDCDALMTGAEADEQMLELIEPRLDGVMEPVIVGRVLKVDRRTTAGQGG